MIPFLAQVMADGPEHAEWFDGAGRFDLPYVLRLPTKLIEDSRDSRLRPSVIAADEHLTWCAKHPTSEGDHGQSIAPSIVFAPAEGNASLSPGHPGIQRREIAVLAAFPRLMKHPLRWGVVRLRSVYSLPHRHLFTKPARALLEEGSLPRTFSRNSRRADSGTLNLSIL
jgi:hypothetical protein